MCRPQLTAAADFNQSPCTVMSNNSSSTVRESVKDGSHQPMLFAFPKGFMEERKAMLKLMWFSLYPCRHYVESNDSARCRVCMLVTKQNVLGIVQQITPLLVILDAVIAFSIRTQNLDTLKTELIFVRQFINFIHFHLKIPRFERPHPLPDLMNSEFITMRYGPEGTVPQTRSYNSLLSCMYGLPKSHKLDVLLRPVASTAVLPHTIL